MTVKPLTNTQIAATSGWLIWSLVLAGWSLSCQNVRAQVVTRPLSGYVSPTVAQLPPARALLLPTENQTQHKRFEETFQGILETKLRSVQLFHVVHCPKSSCRGLNVPQLCKGSIPMARIAELRRKYRADMIIVSAITEFHPYHHPKVGIELHIIETANAETIASFSGVWDSRVKCIAQRACCYFESHSRGGPLCNTELVLRSPRYFSEYVANDLAQGLAELWNARASKSVRSLSVESFSAAPIPSTAITAKDHVVP